MKGHEVRLASLQGALGQPKGSEISQTTDKLTNTVSWTCGCSASGRDFRASCTWMPCERHSQLISQVSDERRP